MNEQLLNFCQEGNFVWSRTGVKISETYFDRYENQGNTDENCLLMKNNRRYKNWYDYSCDAKSRPICQKFDIEHKMNK